MDDTTEEANTLNQALVLSVSSDKEPSVLFFDGRDMWCLDSGTLRMHFEGLECWVNDEVQNYSSNR